MSNKSYHWIKNDEGKIVGEIIFSTSELRNNHYGNVTFNQYAIKNKQSDGTPYLEMPQHVVYIGPHSSKEEVVKAFDEAYRHRGFIIEETPQIR